MRLIKKKIDEREELELLRIEHVCFWLLFWGLFISIIVQAFMNAPFTQYAPEWILFMLSSLGMGISLLRKGLWDHYTTPSLKTYFITSLITTFVVGILFGVTKYISYEVFREDIFGMLLPTVLIYSGCIFVLVFVVIFTVGQLTLRRRKRLEESYKDEKEE